MTEPETPSPSDEPSDEEIPQAAEAMARLLANLSGRSVAGFFPDPLADLSLEQMMANPSLVPPLDIELQMVRYGDPHAAAQTILAAMIQSTAEEREGILAEIGGGDLDKDGFYSYLLDLLRTDLVTTGDISVERVPRLIPEYGPKTLSRPLEDWELRDCYFTWFQTLNLRPTWGQFARALRYLSPDGESGEAPIGEERRPA